MNYFIAALVATILVSLSTNIVLADLNDGLVAYYPFNGNANDESGNENHGVVYGATLTEDRFSSSESAYEFDGIDDYIEVPDSPSLRPNDHQLTVTLWVKALPVEGTPGVTLIRKGIGCVAPGWAVDFPHETGFEADGTPIRFFAFDADSIFSWGYMYSHQRIVQDKWYFIATVADGDKTKIFINGLPSGQSDIDSSINIDTDYPVSIGANQGVCEIYHNFLKGTIDDIRIYNRPLSESEIIELYNEGIALHLKLPLPPTKSWLLTVEAGGRDLWGGIDDYHTGSGYYSLDFDDITEEDGQLPNVPVLAAGNGRVLESFYHNAYGNTVLIDHDDPYDGTGYTTRYAHMKEEPIVEIGQYVQQGTPLGIIGTTGWSDGTHLHFQTYFNNSSHETVEELKRVLVDGLGIGGYRVGTEGDPLYYFSTNFGSRDDWTVPENIGPPINQSYMDAGPSISADGMTLYFHSNLLPSEYPDIFYSTFDGENWSTPNEIDAINSDHIDSDPSISLKGDKLYFDSNRPGGYGDYDLYFSNNIDGIWQPPQSISELNTSYREFGPSISSDDNALYFASDRPGGLGNDDIYVSQKIGEFWQAPINISVINSSYSEGHPSISTNGDTLYFSSPRTGGIGLSDIYFSAKINGDWQTPINLGMSINSDDYDADVCISSDNNSLYFGSTQLGGYGEWDIYVSQKKEDNFPLDQPYTMGYGFCDPDYFGGRRVHKGIDLFTTIGSSVYSVCDGAVELNWTDHYYPTEFLRYWNSFLIVRHDCYGETIYGYYGHLRSNLAEGTMISSGDMVGRIRAAYDQNNVRRPSLDHLHFGLNINYVNSGWGIAPYGTSCETLIDEGWRDPIEYFGWLIQ